MTVGQVTQWDWETIQGKKVPKISAHERAEWAELGRKRFLSFEESALRVALQRKIQYRAKKLGAVKHTNLVGLKGGLS